VTQAKLQLEQVALSPGKSFRLLHWNDNVHDVEIVFPGGETRPFSGTGDTWHFHPEFEIMLVTRGSGTRFIGDHIAALSAIDLVLIGSGLPHCWHGLHDSSGYAIQFGLDGAHPLHVLDEARELEPLWREARYGLQFSGCTQHRVADLMTAMPAQRGVGRFASFMQILDILLDAPEADRSRLSGKALGSSKKLDSCLGIQEAIAFILEHSQEGLTLNDVLGHTAMSKATFSRHFKAHTGKTFTRFLSEVRIDFAARQLIETSRSISEIAFDAGFNNLSHFNHNFRLVRDCTPRVFRHGMRPAV